MIDDQICSVALNSVASTDLDDLSIGRPEEREQIQQDPDPRRSVNSIEFYVGENQGGHQAVSRDLDSATGEGLGQFARQWSYRYRACGTVYISRAARRRRSVFSEQIAVDGRPRYPLQTLSMASMHTEALITVAICTYNRHEHLKKLLRLLLSNQTLSEGSLPDHYRGQ